MSTLRVEALEQPDGTAFVFNNKNLLINGGMNVWQRETNATGKTTAGYHSADRWRIGAVGGTAIGTWTLSRSTDVPSAQGFGYSFKMDCTTANASPSASSNTTLQQRLEGQNLQHLLKGTSSAKAITLSFWIKSNKTGTYIIELVDQDNSRHICKSYTISSASTWEKKKLTFEGDTSGVLDNDNAESLRVNWWIASGSDYTSGTLATSWASSVDANRAVGQVNLADSTSNEWYMTGCQLEVGSTASGFEFEPYDKILARCYRYYSKMITDSAGRRCATAVGDNTTNAVVAMVLPTALRAVPSIVESNMVLRNSGTNFTINTINSITPDLADRNYFSFTCVSTGLTGTRTYNVRHNAADAYIDFDSEL